MARPSLMDLVNTQQAWDQVINDNNAVLRDNPFPVAEYPSVSSILALDPTQFDRCLAASVDGRLFMSDGAAWREIVRDLGGGAQKGAYTCPCTLIQQLDIVGPVGTISTTGLIPEGVLLLGVTARVSIPIVGPTDYDVGRTGNLDIYGAGIGLAAGTQVQATDWTAFPAQMQLGGGGGSDVIFTANGGNFASGRWQVAAHVLSYGAPTIN